MMQAYNTYPNQQGQAQAQSQILAQQQQQQRLRQQQQLLQHQAAQQAAQQQARAHHPAELAPQVDGNDGLRNAKRRKPTDRSLPTFMPSPSPRLAASSATLEKLSQGYMALQAVERKLDWTLSRKKIELAEQVTGARMGGVSRTLRFHVETTLVDQAWQKSAEELASLTVGPEPLEPKGPTPPPAPDVAEKVVEEEKEEDVPMDIPVDAPPPTEGKPAPPADTAAESVPVLDEAKVDDVSVQPEALPPSVGPASVSEPVIPLPTANEVLAVPSSIPVEFGKGTGVPRFSIVLKSELLGEESEKSKLLSTYIKRIVVETDRDPALYDQTAPMDWRRTTPVPALSLTLSSSVPTKVRFAVHLEHHPEQFTLVPEFAGLLDMKYGDRVAVLGALWMYVRGRGLLDDERKLVRTDPPLRKLFAGQDKVPFHHLPEYVNRFLVPLQPVYVEYTVPMEGTTHRAAFDLELSVDDPSRAAVERVVGFLTGPDRTAKELASLDEKIAADATSIKTARLKRSFLAAFADRPIEVLESYVASQAKDLELVLGSGGGVGEELRRSEGWQGDWVEDGAGVWSARAGEGKLREMQAMMAGRR